MCFVWFHSFLHLLGGFLFFFFLFFQLWLFLGYLDSKSWNAVYAIASAGQLDSEVKEDSLWPLVVM